MAVKCVIHEDGSHELVTTVNDRKLVTNAVAKLKAAQPVLERTKGFANFDFVGFYGALDVVADAFKGETNGDSTTDTSGETGVEGGSGDEDPAELHEVPAGRTTESF